MTDNCTGLMWQQDTAPGTYTWQEALKYCEGLDLGGHDDWRLPNVRELHSIVDYGRVLPAIDPVFGAQSDWYWSSSSSAAFPDVAWDVRFYDGNVFRGSRKGGGGFVRAVRNAP